MHEVGAVFISAVDEGFHTELAAGRVIVPVNGPECRLGRRTLFAAVAVILDGVNLEAVEAGEIEMQDIAARRVRQVPTNYQRKQIRIGTWIAWIANDNSWGV